MKRHIIWKPLVKIFSVFIICCWLHPEGYAIESPQYRVVYSQSDFQVRLYSQSSWMSATLHGTSFNKSTKDAFHRVYKYIQGANLNSTHIAMTAPVLTSVNPSIPHGAEYTIRFFLTPKYEESPPQPNPEVNLQLEKWRSHCIAVRVFSGFAQDDTIAREIKGLQTSLDAYLFGKPAYLEKNSYTIAQYNASFHLTGRVNEVWMNISGLTAQGCP